MIKSWLTPVLLWLFLPFAYGNNGVPIVLVSQKAVSGNPGEVTTVVFRIENSTAGELNLKPGWTLPSGWTAIADKSPFSLPAGKSTTKLLSIHIPGSAMAGTYPLRFEISSPGSNEIFNSLNIDFTINEIRRLQMTLADVPESVEAGAVIQGSFIIHNFGNKGEELSILPANCELLSEKNFFLNPNESKVINVKSRTLSNLRRPGRSVLSLDAVIKNEQTQDTVGHISCAVRVVPKARYEIVEGRQLPVYIRLSHLTRKWQDGRVSSGLQGELFAQGTIDEAGENTVEVRLRGPDRFGLSMLGQYDEYYASLENSRVSVFLGDKMYTLSPMTEFARYGRGAEASMKINQSEFGGFYHRPRFFPDIKEEVAGYYRFNGINGTKISANLLQKKYTAERGEAVLGSVHGVFTPISQTTVEAELSRGTFSGNWGNGFFLNINSRIVDKLAVSSNFIFADKNYPGYYNSTISFYGQGSYQLFKKLTVTMLYQEDERNAERDTFFSISPISKTLQMGLSYHIGNGFSLLGNIRKMEQEDRMAGRKFHFVEDIARLQIEKNWRDVHLSLTGEYGIREDLLRLPEDRLFNTAR